MTGAGLRVPEARARRSTLASDPFSVFTKRIILANPLVLRNVSILTSPAL